MKRVKIIGAGLAGCEAAWYLANKGIQVDLYEQRPKTTTQAHQTEMFAELVCSNSLRSNDILNAVGILKNEMIKLDSIIMKCALLNEVNAGSALAVDREGFSKSVTKYIKDHENINIINEEVESIDVDEYTMICSGPLTSDRLSDAIKKMLGEDYFYFFDAAAPIVSSDSIDFNKVYLKSRYDKGDAAYLNCPMTEEEFFTFYYELIGAKCVEIKEFEQNVFEGCMPIEVMARRGRQTLLFGPMKPVGLETPDGVKPYAVVQLRQDNASKTLYNLVGFQTHLTWGEQKRILRLIPGLENVNIERYGVMHKNCYINSPTSLKDTYQLKNYDKVFMAGQITGVEGYVESASSGINAAINMHKLIVGEQLVVFPRETAIGSLAHYITNASPVNFQPMNITFGIIKPLEGKVDKKLKKQMLSTRAQEVMDEFINEKL